MPICQFPGYWALLVHDIKCWRTTRARAGSQLRILRWREGVSNQRGSRCRVDLYDIYHLLRPAQTPTRERNTGTWAGGHHSENQPTTDSFIAVENTGEEMLRVYSPSVVIILQIINNFTFRGVWIFATEQIHWMCGNPNEWLAAAGGLGTISFFHSPSIHSIMF